MLGMLESLSKAVVGAAVAVPVSAVADVVTMGGILTDRDGPYTADAAASVLENLRDATSPE